MFSSIRIRAYMVAALFEKTVMQQDLWQLHQLILSSHGDTKGASTFR